MKEKQMRMMKTAYTGAAALVMTAAMSMNALALSVGDTITIEYGANHVSNFQGGELSVNVLDGNNQVSASYTSFCLEKNEGVSLSTPYTVSSIAEYAEAAAGYGHGATDVEENNVTTARDVLSDTTRWLFWQYITDSNSLMTFSDGSGSSFSFDNKADLARIVQITIWKLEDEYDESPGQYVRDAGEIGTNFYSYVTGSVNPDEDFSSVKAINIEYTTEDGTVYGQSQLTHVVPAPASMMLFGLGMAGLTLIGRRRNAA